MDFCSDISVIPQFIGTCWFNAILMSCFYSQEMRKLMIKQSKIWVKNNNIFKFFKIILKNSYDVKEKKNLELFHKIKPEKLLLQILNKYDKELLKHILSYNIKSGWYSAYISIFLKYLGINVLDISYINDNKILLNFYKKNNDILLMQKTDEIDYNTEFKEINDKIINTPDVLIFNTYRIEYEKNYEYLLYIDKHYYVYNSKTYNLNKEHFQELLDFKDTITFQSSTYKLDSVLLDNYNNLENNHAISGITCNNNRYVYNGWNSKTEEPSFNKNGNILPCSLMRYDWNLNEDKEFCLNPKDCKLDNITDIKDLCFSFNKGRRTLVYIKINGEKTENISSSSFKSFSKINARDAIIDNYNIDKLSLEEIIKKLKELNYITLSSLSLNLLKEILIRHYLDFHLKSSLNKKNIEYFTKLEIDNFNEDELIVINGIYYLKKILFYYLFILKLRNPDMDFEIIKEIFLYYFNNKPILEIYNTYFKNTAVLMTNLKQKMAKDFYEPNISLNSKSLKIIIPKLFKEEFISLYLTNENFKLDELIEYLKSNKNKEFIFVLKFNELELTSKIKSIEEIIEYLNKEFGIRGGNKIKKLKRYR